MAAPTPEAIESARRKVQQAKARLQALEARAATLNRKADARRKIILGGLLLDAAMKDPAWESRLNDLMNRISRDQEHIAAFYKQMGTSKNCADRAAELGRRRHSAAGA